MDSKLASKPGTNAPRVVITTDASADDLGPRQSTGSRATDVRNNDGPNPRVDGPRRNLPHQLAPSVWTDNPLSPSSDHASGSQRTLGRHLQRDTGKSKVPYHCRHPDDKSSHRNYAPRRRKDNPRKVPC
ncbi:hypothetical protein LIER_31752 [Lithospermum erythrorhizon]|uniref:Uncharacterized protein n=1 Tax=Lithospermum erythrorhizon TaxID=34254 RepID=A0AAV3RSM1_LITER